MLLYECRIPRARAGEMSMQQQTSNELEALLRGLPADLASRVRSLDGLDGLLEIVMDLGRLPEARFAGREDTLRQHEITAEDIAYVISHIGQFGGDNRAGIERTLHRISALRNRAGKVVGLTLRVGRAVYGTVDIIRDIVESGRSILLLGRPGVGKTTMLREVARVLADEFGKRVVVVDTSNEIAGDGDIPHPGIGRARRMQVPTPSLQHAVMIEAVENHMPEVVVIDEIGTEQEAAAARTIAERGVQLIATAHGNTLENRMLNPPRTGFGDGERQTIKVYPFGVSWNRVEEAARGLGMPIAVVREPEDADVVVTLKNYYRRKTPRLRNAESAGIPIYIARSNSTNQIASALASVAELRRAPEEHALDEAREAIEQVVNGQKDEVELAPQNAYIRRLQHELAERASLSSRSTGHEPVRRVQIYR